MCLLARTGKQHQLRHVQEADVAQHQVSALDVILALLYYLKRARVRRRELRRSRHVRVSPEERKATRLVTVLQLLRSIFSSLFAKFPLEL